MPGASDRSGAEVCAPRTVDLQFAGRSNVIATAVLGGPGEAALIDPGPAASLATLERGLEARGVQLADVTRILLTHIHLDHAGATGSIVSRFPHITVLVHELGVPHLIDPSRLVRSATRLFGDEVMRSFGGMTAVPAANLQPLRGGECVRAAGAAIEVAYTPGHASHHVSYLDRSTGCAYVGDAAGVRLDGGFVMPPTPPPDIDIDLWYDSITRIEQWAPRTLFLTHFGLVADVREHLAAFRDNLTAQSRLARELLAGPGTDDERAGRFAAATRGMLSRRLSRAQVAAYESVVPMRVLWLGLARYWSRPAVGSGTAGGGEILGAGEGQR